MSRFPRRKQTRFERKLLREIERLRATRYLPLHGDMLVYLERRMLRYLEYLTDPELDDL